MQVRTRAETLRLARTFTIARSSTDVERVLVVELEHDGLVGTGEGAPVDYAGETVESMQAAASSPEVAEALGDDPFALERITARLAAALPGPHTGVRMALDGALHDWVGRRLDSPVWRLLGLTPSTPPTSYTIGIDTVEGTVDRVRSATGFQVLKVKLGGPDDLARLEAVRANTGARIRVDGNGGWSFDVARELMPVLARMGVEFAEQPFPVEDVDAYRRVRELPERVPVMLDESVTDARQVAAVASYADGVNLKLSKTGGIREAVRAVHVARALGLSVMLGCMIESELGIAQAVAIASLADYVDLDGHLLVRESPFHGLALQDGRVLASAEPGLGVRRR